MGNVDPENLSDVMRYHPPRDQDVIHRHEAVWMAAEQFAQQIMMYAPDCKDRDTAIERVREAKMWANSAIALDGLV